MDEGRPSYDDVRHALTSVVTYGLVPFSVATYGESLVALEIVQARMPDGLRPKDGDRYEQAATAALTEVLREAVDGIRSRNYRMVLEYVLPLMPELRDTDVTHRRTEVGKVLRNRPLKAGSVRVYYERKALDQLANDLLEAEADAGGARRRQS